MQGVLLDEGAVGRLKWRCRRGLLENDLFIERFFARHGSQLTESEAGAMTVLMDLGDNDLLDLLLVRKEPEGELDVEPVRNLLALMRTPGHDKSRGTRDDTPGR